MKKISILLIILGTIVQAHGYSGYTHWYVNSTQHPITFTIRYKGEGELSNAIRWCTTDRITLQPEGRDGDRVSRRPDVCSISSIISQSQPAFSGYEPSMGFAGSAVFHFEQANDQAPVTLTRKPVTTQIPRRSVTTQIVPRKRPITQLPPKPAVPETIIYHG